MGGGGYHPAKTVKTTKHLRFDETRDTGKTKQWTVVSTKTEDDLGIIKWHPPWRRYIFEPDWETIFDSSCLSIIKEFIDEQMEARKVKK